MRRSSWLVQAYRQFHCITKLSTVFSATRLGLKSL